MTKKSVCLGFMAFDVAFDLPAKETLGWRGAAKPLLLLEQLTMAHNQDRLQNSDSSVVYGHGHIIHSHTAQAGSKQFKPATHKRRGGLRRRFLKL